MTVKKFRKKPVEIEAIQWTGGNLKECENFLGWTSFHNHIQERHPGGRNIIRIKTLEGIMDAEVNDWIIRGIKGECYPCKPDIFEKTYEEVIAPSDIPAGYENTLLKDS